MPVDVIDYFLDHPPRPDTIYEISGSGGVAFTARACEDVARLDEPPVVPAKSCRTCRHADPGKARYRDPEFFCMPGGRSDRVWSAALKWQNVNMVLLPPEAPFSSGLSVDADDCPGWAGPMRTP